MQVGNLRLERDDGMAITGDVPRTSGADAHPPRGLDHGIDDSRMAPHPEIIVRAPHDDLARSAAATPSGVGWALGVPLEAIIVAAPPDLDHSRRPGSFPAPLRADLCRYRRAASNRRVLDEHVPTNVLLKRRAPRSLVSPARRGNPAEAALKDDVAELQRLVEDRHRFQRAAARSGRPQA
jgi:hypothetical protein